MRSLAKTEPSRRHHNNTNISRPHLILGLNLVVALHGFSIGRWWSDLRPSLAIPSSSTLLGVIRRLGRIRRTVLLLALLVDGAVRLSLGGMLKRLV